MSSTTGVLLNKPMHWSAPSIRTRGIGFGVGTGTGALVGYIVGGSGVGAELGAAVGEGVAMQLMRILPWSRIMQTKVADMIDGENLEDSYRKLP